MSRHDYEHKKQAIADRQRRDGLTFLTYIRGVLRHLRDTVQCRAVGAGVGPRSSHPKPRRPHYQEIVDSLAEDARWREMRADDDLRRRVQFDQET